jgi:hypothetical protein
MAEHKPGYRVRSVEPRLDLYCEPCGQRFGDCSNATRRRDVQSLCRRCGDAVTTNTHAAADRGAQTVNTGFLFGLAAGIVTGATIWSPATARPLDAYADPYAPAPVPDPPVVLAMPAAPHFGVTVHQTVETRLL